LMVDNNVGHAHPNQRIMETILASLSCNEKDMLDVCLH
jgi:hypothetical protein